jgi:hypothetical protein
MCVEINSVTTGELWEMPKTISKVVAKLVVIGCDPLQPAYQLQSAHLGGKFLDALNGKLRAAGQSVFGADTLTALKKVLE